MFSYLRSRKNSKFSVVVNNKDYILRACKIFSVLLYLLNVCGVTNLTWFQIILPLIIYYALSLTVLIVILIYDGCLNPF